MIDVVPDLLATENLADLGNETRQFPSELGPRHSCLGIDQEFFADQIVQRRGNAVLCSDTASHVLEFLFGHGASRNCECSTKWSPNSNVTNGGPLGPDARRRTRLCPSC